MNFTRVIYLDPSLISEAYSEITGKTPPTRITRTHELSGGVGVAVVKIGAAAHEQREYPVSSTQMFTEIESALRNLPALQSPRDVQGSGPFWVKGILCVGAQSDVKNHEVIKELYQFTIWNEDRDLSKEFILATNDACFTPGYDYLAADKDLLSHGMWEPVEALLRPLFINQKLEHSLFAPFVILNQK